MSAPVESLSWTGEAVRLLDQRLLPEREEYLELTTPDEVIDAIVSLAVRGANVLGTAGAFGFALGVRAGGEPGALAERIIAARPTAVNLAASVHAALRAQLDGGDPLAVAQELLAADRAATRAIGEHGRAELAGATRILTHCNTGALATTGWGTALGVIYAKAAAGEPVSVVATETRPVGQGRRLTVWELRRAGIDVTLIADSAAAIALERKLADAVIVGADRIAANGDTANKIGTYPLALGAARAGVPFYVAATLNAIDPALPDGSGIPIEFRDGDEVRGTGPDAVDPAVQVWNPAFDITPADLIAGIITEVGVLRPPFGESIARALTGSGS